MITQLHKSVEVLKPSPEQEPGRPRIQQILSKKDLEEHLISNKFDWLKDGRIKFNERQFTADHITKTNNFSEPKHYGLEVAGTWQIIGPKTVWFEDQDRNGKFAFTVKFIDDFGK